MEREWLITLLYYRSLGTTKNELQFYKVGDHYEMAHVTKTLSASIDENKQNNELDLRANEKYETNTALVNYVFRCIDYWSDVFAEVISGSIDNHSSRIIINLNRFFEERDSIIQVFY